MTKDVTKKFEQDFVFASVPSAVNSHKPPIFPLLKHKGIIDATDTDKCLEIFGRYLLPNCVTYGNQCLQFQYIPTFFERLQLQVT